jgi:hypothetical protein
MPTALKSRDQADQQFVRMMQAAVFAISGTLFVAVVTLTLMTHPTFTSWLSSAAQAETEVVDVDAPSTPTLVVVSPTIRRTSPKAE